MPSPLLRGIFVTVQFDDEVESTLWNEKRSSDAGIFSLPINIFVLCYL